MFPDLSPSVLNLGPVQTLLYSCAEPNSTEDDFGVMADSDGILASNLIQEELSRGKQFSVRKCAF